jgi:hypothetical protein
MAAAAHTLPH